MPAYYTRLQKRKHNKQLHDYVQGSHTELLRRSLLGQVKVYNRLQQDTVNATSVKNFQRKLQDELKAQARLQETGGNLHPWRNLFSARYR